MHNSAVSFEYFLIFMEFDSSSVSCLNLDPSGVEVKSAQSGAANGEDLDQMTVS